MNNRIVIIVLSLLLTSGIALNAQYRNIVFEADTLTIFPNPERGWRYQTMPKCCDKPEDIARGIILPPHDLHEVEELMSWRTSENAVTVFKDDVKIQQWNSDIPQSRLDEIQTDLNTIRDAGQKQIFRLVYNWCSGGFDPEESIIIRHIDQLKPVIQKNADVIFAVEFGIFGGCGEAVNSVHYLGRENNNRVSLNEAGLRIYHKLMDIVPDNRMMLIHYPHFKYDMMYWEDGNNFPADAVPITRDNAFDGSKQSRIGYYNDNFAGDENHWGFFYAWPEQEKAFVEQDALYVTMTGELSGATEFNKKNGARELQKYRFTTYQPTGDGGKEIISYWKSTGQWDVIARSLGYRFRLVSASLPSALRPGNNFRLSLVMANDGWAGIMNSRLVEIILRNSDSGEQYVLTVDGDGKGNRLWLPGPGETKTLDVSGGIPENITPGFYEVILNLPDPYPSIHDRPEYSIRLANKNIWEESTGYNLLRHDMIIKKRAGGNRYKGNNYFTVK
jgi:hypothetical protein